MHGIATPHRRAVRILLLLLSSLKLVCEIALMALAKIGHCVAIGVAGCR